MRLVFYELLPGRVRLDVITEVGEPATLEASLPANLWAVAAVGALDRWAADSRPIALAIREGRHGRRLVVSDGETRITLEPLESGSAQDRPPRSRAQVLGLRSLAVTRVFRP